MPAQRYKAQHNNKNDNQSQLSNENSEWSDYKFSTGIQTISSCQRYYWSAHRETCTERKKERGREEKGKRETETENDGARIKKELQDKARILPESKLNLEKESQAAYGENNGERKTQISESKRTQNTAYNWIIPEWFCVMQCCIYYMHMYMAQYGTVHISHGVISTSSATFTDVHKNS